MSFSYPQVSIDGNEYNVYSDLADATNYIDGIITEAGDAWRVQTDICKQCRALVSATRWLEAAAWSGTRTDMTNSLSFPRMGLTDPVTGEAVDDTTLPAQIIAATQELAAMLIVDPDLRANLANPIAKEQRAGPVLQEFFRPHDVQVTTFFPANIMSLIGQWMAGPTVFGAVPHDVHEKSELRRPFDFIHGI